MRRPARVAIALSLALGALAGTWLLSRSARARLRQQVASWRLDWEFRERLLAPTCDLTDRLRGCRDLPPPRGPLAAYADSALRANPRLRCQSAPARQWGEYRFAPPPFEDCVGALGDTTLGVSLGLNGTTVILSRQWAARPAAVVGTRLYGRLAAQLGPGTRCPPSDVPRTAEWRWQVTPAYNLAVWWDEQGGWLGLQYALGPIDCHVG